VQVSFQFLRNDESVRKALQKDGWHLQSGDQSNSLRARHPDITEESAARQRLTDLGLLTSRFCRIEFQRVIVGV
jgi:hypothetical protein